MRWNKTVRLVTVYLHVSPNTVSMGDETKKYGDVLEKSHVITYGVEPVSPQMTSTLERFRPLDTIAGLFFQS